MVKVVENNERICTVNLDGSECSIVFQSYYKYFTVKNESDSKVYISLKRDIVPESDGVMTVNSKESATITNMQPNVNMFFASGSGKIQVFASNSDKFVNPFKSAPAASDGGVQASGNPVVMDGLQGGVPFSEIVVSGDNIIGQDLTVNVSGKNLIPPDYMTQSGTYNGVTVTVKDDGRVDITGTATSDGYILTILMNYPLIGGKKYTFNCSKQYDVNTFNFAFVIRDKNGNWKYALKSYPATIIADEGDYISSWQLWAYNGIEYSAENVEIQMEIGDIATEYKTPVRSTTNITPDINPYVIPKDIRQVEGLNNISVSEGELSVVGVRKNAAVKKIWDEIGDVTAVLETVTGGVS